MTTVINGLCKPGANYEACDGLFVYHIRNSQHELAVYFEKGRDKVWKNPQKEEFESTFATLMLDGWSPVCDDLLEKLRW